MRNLERNLMPKCLSHTEHSYDPGEYENIELPEKGMLCAMC